MTEEQLAAIPRRDADEVIARVAEGLGSYSDRLHLAVECAMNEAWWRGYHAGRRAVTDAATPCSQPEIVS